MKRFFLSSVTLSLLAGSALAAPPVQGPVQGPVQAPKPVQAPVQAPKQAPVQAPVQSPVQKGTTAAVDSGYRTYSYQPSDGYYYGSRMSSPTAYNTGMRSAGWKVTGR